MGSDNGMAGFPDSQQDGAAVVVDDATPDGIAEAEDGGSEMCLVCAVCRYPLARAAEIIEEQVSTLKAAVYGYELDVCERSCWCYSATNPGDVRFDVVRLLPGAAVEARSPPTAHHSWFPGYAWRMGHCGRCRAHL